MRVTLTSAVLCGTQSSPAGEHVWVIVCHMALILICIYVFAPISGAHFNPAGT
jgi:glycerol uptake facilitator-like aquaporin